MASTDTLVELSSLTAIVNNIDEDTTGSEDQSNRSDTAMTNWKVPYAMFVISLVQVVLFMFTTIPGTMQALHFDPQLQWQVWRFLTYMLLHVDAEHLLLNVVMQCFSCVYLERYVRGWKVCAVYVGVYVGGGVVGVLGASAVADGFLVGSSAGIFALLLCIIPQIFYLQPSTSISITTIEKYFRIFIIGVACLANIIIGISNASSVAVHLFGAVHGFLVGLILFARDNEDNYTKNVPSIATILLSWLLSALIIVNAIKYSK